MSQGWMTLVEIVKRIADKHPDITTQEVVEAMPKFIKMGLVEQKEIGGKAHYRITGKGLDTF